MNIPIQMRPIYRDVAKAFFPNAKIIIDRFHVVRYCTEAMDNVRRSFQKTLPDDQKKYHRMAAGAGGRGELSGASGGNAGGGGSRAGNGSGLCHRQRRYTTKLGGDIEDGTYAITDGTPSFTPKTGS